MLTNLKQAIQNDGRKQFRIAQLAGMTEGRLTRIITGRVKVTKTEKKDLATVLKIAEKMLFEETK